MSERFKPSQIQEQADNVVSEYVDQQARQAFQHAIDKVHGKGCMCKNCLGTAVTEANQWIDFLDSECEYPTFKHDGSKVWMEEDE